MQLTKRKVKEHLYLEAPQVAVDAFYSALNYVLAFCRKDQILAVICIGYVR